MQFDILAYVKLFKWFAEKRDFVLRIPIDGGVACTPMRIGADMTVKDLKAVAAAASGIASRQQMMNHIGVELRTGTLLENCVRPGSCIIVSDVFNI